MQQKTHGIVLHALKYGDSSLIVKIFTQDFGLKSFMVKGFRSKTSNLRASLFMPLTLLTMDIGTSKTTSNFSVLKEANCHEPLHHLQSDFGKQAIALFMAEVLYKTIADEAAHEDLYYFIEGLLKFLNEAESAPSIFPHYFLVRYSRYLGLFPHDDGELQSPFFDMRDGVFNKHQHLHSDFMMEEESRALKQLLEIPLSKLHELKMGNTLRNNLLVDLLQYYKIHLLNFREIKSHLVLAEVLRG
ncbi:MAG: DNA repair protein RecO [Bacteroidetes bacterium]|nr:DNA repair protein RecO [Bacteroidota bacterium]